MRSTATRQAIAQSSPTALRTRSSVSSQKRARLASEPPYSSRAPVVVRREELPRQVRVRAVDVDDVEARAARLIAPRAPSRPAPGGCRASSSPGARARERSRSRSARAPPRPAATRCSRRARPCARARCPRVRRAVCASSQVAASTRTSRSSHMRADTYGVSSDSGVIAQYSVLTARPAALGLDGAVTRLRPRLLGAEARAVRHLVEAVAQRLRPDAKRLEEHVVARIASHRAGA